MFIGRSFDDHVVARPPFAWTYRRIGPEARSAA
jgi:hypothetical protein